MRSGKRMQSLDRPSTKSMKIDILSVSQGQDVLKAIKGLNRVEEFVEYSGKDKRKIITYIVLLYSKDSILNERIPIPFSERQMKAYNYAGFPRDAKGEMKQDLIKKLITLEDEKVFDMVFAFMKFQNSNEWREIVTLEHEIEELHKLRMRPIAETTTVKAGAGTKEVFVSDKDIMAASEKKNKLWEGTRTRIKELNSLWKAFWGDDDLSLKKSKSKGRVSMESWAEDNAEL